MSAFKEFDIKWGMVVDLDKCTGCGACMVSCQVENNIAPMEDASNKLRTLSWMLVYKLENGLKYPEHDVAYLPRPCMQCGHPSCVSVCPVVATDKNENGGIVSQVYPRCIGCRYCMAACPYHSRYFGWFDPHWPEGMEKTLTPFVSTRPRGVVEKCTFCHHRWNLAKEKARKEGGDPNSLPDGAYVPACAEACPTGAISFGDLKNPEHKVHELHKSKYARRILERLGTDPQVYYMSKRSWVLDLLDNDMGDGSHGSNGGGHHG
ncbi:MAG: menaquinone reductase iron-sulfur cluster-binding subunit QrcC [Desulfovibrio sp.]|uniref:menaquinone reductase iron-sulfur cluster-binding subunit QrcC n=1 Tax=Desulfovibrio sp. 7SRBS1 TaxID=3378064 RepID=UPI003B41D5AE